MTIKTYLTQEEVTHESLIHFDNIEEMNTAIKSHKEIHAEKLKETDKKILEVISRYSCKYAGVTYLSKAKISSAAGFKNRRTAIRTCNKLEELGIITQYETKRVKGDRRQSSNIIVINHVESIEKIEVNISDSKKDVTPESHTKETIFKSINSNNTSLDTEQAEKNINNNLTSDEVIKQGLKHSIPHEIYNAIAPFFNGQELYNIYGVLLRAKAKIDRNITLEVHHEAYNNAFYNVIMKYKAGKVRKLDGLLYQVWQQVTAEISRRINYNNNDNGSSTMRLFSEIMEA